MRRVWNARLLGAGLLVALVAALAVAGAASARGNANASSAGGVSALDYPTVIHIDGAANKTCSELDSYGAPGASWLELKFDSGNLPSVGNSKTLSNSYLSVTLTRTGTDVWSWTSTKGVDAVFVKSGASGHNLYLYDPPTEATSGSGLTVPGKNGTSHVAFCYDEEQAPEHGRLKVVKVLAGDVPDGVTFGDFSFSVDGGSAVAFDADGVSDELDFVAGTSHDVVEPEANGDGYTTSYSDECSDGVIVAGQTIVCTITNTFHPGGGDEHGKLKVVKVLAGDVPDGVTFGDFSFSVDGGSAVAFDADGVSDELDFVAGTSHDVVEPEANGDGYTTSYSDECSDGVIVAGQTIVCTITNTFHHHGGEPGDLHITKTAVGHFDVQHHWTIDKQVKLAGASDATYSDNAALNLPDGGAGSVTWKVVVGHTTTETNFVVNATIEVSNPNDEAVNGVSVSDPDGVVDCSPEAGAQSAGLTIPANGSITCSFVGSPQSKITTNTATATWGNHKSVTATATIAWSKGADLGSPAVVNDGGALEDEVVEGPETFTYDEAWTCHAGTPSPNGGRINEATVTWHGGSDSDTASVTVSCGKTPPPPPPPPHGGESMDVQVVKDATPQVQLVNGQADISYTIRVTNHGPNQAHNVVVSDAAPGGVQFLAVVTQPVNGTCTVTPALLDCSLGTLGPGVERTIVVSARVTQTGTYHNCATVVGEGGDTNAANNTDCAETLVTAPVTPPVVTPPVKPQPQPKPKPHPKPKPKPNVCRILKVNTRMLQANGERHVLVAKVTRSRNPVKGVKVRFNGAGISKAARTNSRGIARITVKTTKAGIIRVNIVNAKACNTARVGVVGVFQPPVTG